jgi:hypothetical protein
MNLKLSPKKPFIFDTQITTHALHLTGCDAAAIVNNAADFFDMQEYVYSFYGLDKICTIYDVYNIEAAALGQKIINFKNELPSVDVSAPFIKEKSDIYKIKNIDFKQNSRCHFVLDLIDIYKDKTGCNYKPRFCAPFSLAANIRGYGNLINDIYEDKKFIKELFKIINTELLAPWICMQRKSAGNTAAIASGADAWVSIPNVNPEIIEDVIIPSYEELKSLSGDIYFSLLGGARYLKYPEKYLELQKIMNPFLVKGTGFDIDALGPDLFRDFADKNKMDLLFGIEASFIAENNVENINKKISDYIKAGQSVKGSFTLYFNDVPADIDPEKLKTIFQHIRNTRDLNLYT